MKTELKELVFSTLEGLIQKMKLNEGINLAISQRLTFEKWLQIELSGQLHARLKKRTEYRVVLEAPISSKISKRAKSIDIAILGRKEKLFSIELKIIATNYSVAGIDKKTKGITDKVDELIEDLNKAKKDGYTEYMSLAFLFPFPIQKDHRNNLLDFPKHIIKLEKHGEVQQFFFSSNGSFNVAFVSLYGKKKASVITEVISNSNKFNTLKDSVKKVEVVSSKIDNHVKNDIPKGTQNITISCKLGKEYFEKGIISFSKDEDQYLPVNSGTKVKVYTANRVTMLKANFTRASNGTRRFINGYSELARYFSNNYKLGDVVKVRIINDKEYQILPK
jgi:hypothetical protein